MSNWNKGRPYAPGPTPNYAPQYAPPAGPPPNGYGDQKSPYEGDRFRPRKRINDPLFLIFFLLQFAGFIVLSGIALNEWVKNGGLGGGVGDNTGTGVTLNYHTVILLLFITAAALVLSTIYLILTRYFTRFIMHFTLILSIALNIGICVYYWTTRYWSGAIIFTIIALFSIFAYFGYRARIPLASLLLQVVMDVAKHHWSVYTVAFIALIVQAAWSVWYTFSVIAIPHAASTDTALACGSGSSCSSGKVAGLIFYATFSYLWTSQVIGNVALATLAGGPFGSWYYFGPRDQGMMPRHPTLSSFGRASTLSLGSIAFGSLINGHPVEVCLACCAECIVGCIEGLVQYFNRYAYIEIAILQAAQSAWHLLRDRGIDALVNDSLVGMTLTWGSYAVGLICSLFAYLYLRYTHPSYNDNGQYTAPVLLFAFLIGLHAVLSRTLISSCITQLCWLGEDPQVLAYRAPALFSLIASTYPQVVQGVPRV
ncbi:plasma-membrane choline transporter-domain-containing protein [Fomitopsis serialis]|uniref:plasma-membrane choline transporter-domain-containing protein n=1 Tax=Fomitopsis serialis TaxID=139415 RepID=UPI002008EA52|nr:plasma-membrane choline transporter-domain-containing protein [Neoantrodia serialis]KAH9935626.1 plasma-membrane choline transporter-domain-containing protein [Neoantrodia serialis]